jgi:ribonuclease HII
LPTLFPSEIQNICGCDEAGRGCLAGPVVAASVILPRDFKHKLLNDSKQISKKNRDMLRKEIEEIAISFGVGIVSPAEIDEINILRASIKAMHLAMDKLSTKPELILIDGNRFYPYHNIPFKTIIKGDTKYFEIAAASILAKTYRDEIMESNHNSFPQYQWNKNMGYPTLAHRTAIKTNGTCSHHRLSFRLLKEENELLF